MAALFMSPQHAMAHNRRKTPLAVDDTAVDGSAEGGGGC
jgi:hypothetical protein